MSRIRIDSLSSWRAEDFARRSGRNFGDALGLLIAAGYRSLTGTAAASSNAPVLVGELSDEEALRPGRTVSSHMRPATISGIERFADLDKRSFSSSVETLVRLGLISRGLWPHTTDVSGTERAPANV